jgi:hypothetical protein
MKRRDFLSTSLLTAAAALAPLTGLITVRGIVWTARTAA